MIIKQLKWAALAAGVLLFLGKDSIKSSVDYLMLPKHMQIALGEMHQRSVLEKMIDDAGGDANTEELYKAWNYSQSNPRVVEYLKAIGIDDGTDAEGYCAGFAVWALNEANAEDNYPHNRSMIPWTSIVKGSPPKVGDIVLVRGKYKDPITDKVMSFAHVGFYWGSDNDGMIYILGGNQRFEVNILKISSNDVLGYIPVTYPVAARYFSEN